MLHKYARSLPGSYISTPVPHAHLGHNVYFEYITGLYFHLIVACESIVFILGSLSRFTNLMSHDVQLQRSSPMNTVATDHGQG